MCAEWSLLFLVFKTLRASATCGGLNESHWASGSLASKNGKEGETEGGVEWFGQCTKLMAGVACSHWARWSTAQHVLFSLPHCPEVDRMRRNFPSQLEITLKKASLAWHRAKFFSSALGA